MDVEPQWFVYVLLSSGGSRERARRSYVGISLDPARRLLQHNGELPGGAKSTRGGRPWRIGRVLGPYSGRGQAQQLEASLKKLSGEGRRLAWEPPSDLEDESPAG